MKENLETDVTDKAQRQNPVVGLLETTFQEADDTSVLIILLNSAHRPVYACQPVCICRNAAATM